MVEKFKLSSRSLKKVYIDETINMCAQIVILKMSCSQNSIVTKSNDLQRDSSPNDTKIYFIMRQPDENFILDI